MKKVKVRKVKTGEIVELTESAYNTLIKNGQRKNIDLIEDKKPVKKGVVPKVDTNEDGKRSASEVIAAIEKAESKESVDVLIDGESRKTVLKAAQKRKSEMK